MNNLFKKNRFINLIAAAGMVGALGTLARDVRVLKKRKPRKRLQWATGPGSLHEYDQAMTAHLRDPANNRKPRRFTEAGELRYAL